MRKFWATAVLFAGIWLYVNVADPVATYIGSVKDDGKAGRAEAAGGALLDMDRLEIRDWTRRIRDEAENRRIEPIDAVIDPVWKAIPGYNGLEVDIEQTLRLAMQRPMSDSIPFVFREIRPAVELEDLPPAPVYKGNPHKPMIAFMVNVAWGDAHIPGLLETFRNAGVKATFFLDGKWLSGHEEMAARIVAEGHELANHGHSHRMMSKLNRQQTIEEIVETEKLLARLDVRNRWFAPPYGDYNEETVRIAHEIGLRTVLWTIDTVDWKNPDPDRIVRKIAARLEPGALILMHPTEASLKALPEVIGIAKQRDLAIGTVRETLSSSRVKTVENNNEF